jgi:hypothetical protein
VVDEGAWMHGSAPALQALSNGMARIVARDVAADITRLIRGASNGKNEQGDKQAEGL